MRQWPRGAAIVLVLAAVGMLLFNSLSDRVGAQSDRRVIVLGIDGMDHRLLSHFIDEGRLPHFERLASTGSFAPLETTMPPLSPVAWSTFITGMDPGGHGIYDFLHRDPLTAAPLESIYQVTPPGRSLSLGSWVIPLSGGGVVAQRKGTAFWELLEDAGVDTTVFRMPVNFLRSRRQADRIRAWERPTSSAPTGPSRSTPTTPPTT